MSELINGHPSSYWEGMEKGMQHSKPSPETERRLSYLESTIKDIHEQNKSALITQSTMLEEIKRMNLSIKSFTESVVELKSWRERIIGASMLAKVLWGVMGVMICAIAASVFSMWLEWQSFEYKVRDIIETELSSLELELVE